MAITLPLYGLALDHLSDADIDWTADTIKVSLHTASYTPNQDTHDFWNDLTNEVTGTNYTTGGAALANKTRTYDTGTNTVKLDADDLSWSSATITNIRYAVIYKSRGGASSADELIGYVDFGGDQTVTSGVFTITWNASGIITLSTA